MTLNTLTKHYSLQAHNTFGIDVMANYFFAYDSEETLAQHLEKINHLNLAILQVGEGSNLLFIHDFKGVILHSQITDYAVTNENKDSVEVRVGAGVIWDKFVAWAVDNGFGGTENLSAIPGTVGASPVQNIGAYGVEAQDIVAQVEAIELATGEKRIFSNKDCQFAYRYSIFKNELKGKYAVTYVTFKLNNKPEFNLSYGNISTLLDGRAPTLESIRQVITEVRNSKLPDHKILGNAGSFFTNPYIDRQHYKALKRQFPNIPHYPVNENEVKVPAGWLIDQCGLKGRQHKHAAVHKEQALVLVNTGNACGQDIVELSQIVIAEVKAKFEITLTPEVNIIG
ncbi:MAG: UDP-N-acetylmuramate dehydrogenase [Bacteroidales bacterium]|jgi:UDP-N-acetylmuramate dehydrogenase|nr:UDP-N-acetylmuramate dehydrogenase [Bacteroidales bacterium]